MATKQIAFTDDIDRVVRLQARSIWYMGSCIKIHADAADTNGQFALLEVLMKPGSEPPLHYHENEDEFFLVLEGELAVTCDGKERILRPGESIFLPRRIPHTFRILTSVARTIGIVTPAGFEDFFRTLGQPIEDGEAFEPPPNPSFAQIAEVAGRFGSRVLR
ncbi:MAG TPA: quercetin 2,3-dioxygenase [Bryobacteraceae bacterium]